MITEHHGNQIEVPTKPEKPVHASAPVGVPQEEGDAEHAGIGVTVTGLMAGLTGYIYGADNNNPSQSASEIAETTEQPSLHLQY